MSKRFLVFQHTAWEGPGKHLIKSALKNTIRLDIIQLWKELIPSLASYDGLLVLGGAPNINQEDQYPFLKEEKQAIKEWLKADRPYLGICLGHQLLAEALGAKVADNYCASIGFIEGYLTHKGKIHPLFKNIPPCLPLFKWHSQAVLEPVPRNLAILATSAECQIEAISIKERPHIVGVQFDNNAADLKNIKKFLQKDSTWLSSFTGKYINPATIIAEAARHEKAIEKQYDTIFRNFICLT
jgi:GMP synthase-like glutamine amidotransferase